MTPAAKKPLHPPISSKRTPKPVIELVTNRTETPLGLVIVALSYLGAIGFLFYAVLLLTGGVCQR